MRTSVRSVSPRADRFGFGGEDARLAAASSTVSEASETASNSAASVTSTSPAPVYAVGDVVNANFNRMGAYYTGRITKRKHDGRYNILYDDGDREYSVSGDLIEGATANAHADAYDIDRVFA